MPGDMTGAEYLTKAAIFNKQQNADTGRTTRRVPSTGDTDIAGIMRKALASNNCKSSMDADAVIQNTPQLPSHVTDGSAAIKQQMDSGKYPTISDHIYGRSPLYAVYYDEFNNVSLTLREPGLQSQ